MEKVVYSRRELHNLEIYNTSGSSSVIYRDGNKIIKIYECGFYFDGLIDNIYNKIVFPKDSELIPEIVRPISLVYENESDFSIRPGNIIGSITPFIEGETYFNIVNRLKNKYDILNPNVFISYYMEFERILKSGSDKKIVFKDFTNRRNIIIDPNDNMKIIDYEGIQIGRYNVLEISRNLIDDVLGDGCDQIIYNGKYYDNFLCTTELNVYNEYILYFLDLLDRNIGREYTRNKRMNRSIDYMFDSIGLDDYDIQHKIWKLFQNEYYNEYLEDDLYRISELYNVKRCDNRVKVLVRK